MWRRPGYVLYAPWRGFRERPWFDALFVFGVLPMARRSRKSRANPAYRDGSFPIDAVTWAEVVPLLDLSPQQTRIVELLLRGMGNKQIAAALDRKLPTIRTQLGRVFDRLDVDDRDSLIVHVFVVTLRYVQHDCRP
jgi:DNA-binding NarL/FixJ family response regulator